MFTDVGKNLIQMENSKIGIKTNKYFSISETKIKISELCFLVFWSLLLFGRAIGWYEGQVYYNVLLLVAISLWGVKMLLTDYSPVEFLTISLLLGFSFVIYLVSGEKGIILCALMVVGVKGVSLKRVFGLGTVVWGTTFFVKLIWNLANLNEVVFATQNKSFFHYVDRYFMGYSHPNVFHISYFMFCTLLICWLKEKVTNQILLLLHIGNLLVFVYSFSLTGFGIVLIYLLGITVFNRDLKKWQYGIFKTVFPIVLVYSILLPLFLSGRAFALADKIFNNRIAFAKAYLKINYLKVFGNNLAAITDSINTMDNSFVFALIIYGVPMFILICVGYFCLIRNMCIEKKKIPLITTLCLLLGGVTEPYLFNMSTKNISLLFLGDYVFDYMGRRFPGKKRLLLCSKLNFDVKLPKIVINLEKCDKNANNKGKLILRLLPIAISATVALGCAIILLGNEAVVYDGYDRRFFYSAFRECYTFATLAFVVVVGIQTLINYGRKGK